jgi:RsiW-degrading membrane proteinase PrsW (M82 family)
MDTLYVVIALLGGFLPVLFWLWFWLREDKAHPEPRRLILTAFIAGIVVVPIVLPLQKYALSRFDGASLVFSWVAIEEILKYSAALIVVLWNKAVDEPIDCIVYMITIALGFSGLENALFIFTPLSNGEYMQTFLTGDFRFLGATLLHVLTSATVGSAMALSFYRPSRERIAFATFGLCIAITLHAFFNFFIMGSNGETILSTFLVVWAGIIALLLVFEKVKMIGRVHRRRY